MIEEDADKRYTQRMRVTKIILITALVCGLSACSSSHTALPKPSAQRIVLHGTVDFNKAQIRPDSLPLLDEAAAALKGRSDLRIIVSGHADSKGSEERNWKLSMRRARKVRDYLVNFGVTDYQIMVVAKGASQPVASNATREGRAQNRRVEIEVQEIP
jgi:OOP family OmpA-OmpF porin